jgi:ribosome modulation factor
MIDQKAAARVGGRYYAAIQGGKAFRAGILADECPYDDSRKAAWMVGWNAAQDRRNDETP